MLAAAFLPEAKQSVYRFSGAASEHKGEFGSCVECGGEIPDGRLTANPAFSLRIRRFNALQPAISFPKRLMTAVFEELDYRLTPIGALSLRRRRDLTHDIDIFEIKLGEEFLMSSMFTASEIALAELGLAGLKGNALEVAVGGLGLGYTAQAVLQNSFVKSLLVIEVLEPVVDWHKQGLLPLGEILLSDSRCRFVVGDFFELAMSPDGFDPGKKARRFDAILVDIDHSPDFLLDPKNAAFYQPEGLASLSRHLRPGGVFGLWSNEQPDERFIARLAEVFTETRAERITFHNPLQNSDFTQTVYLARKRETAG